MAAVGRCSSRRVSRCNQRSRDRSESPSELRPRRRSSGGCAGSMRIASSRRRSRELGSPPRYPASSVLPARSARHCNLGSVSSWIPVQRSDDRATQTKRLQGEVLPRSRSEQQRLAAELPRRSEWCRIDRPPRILSQSQPHLSCGGNFRDKTLSSCRRWGDHSQGKFHTHRTCPAHG